MRRFLPTRFRLALAATVLFAVAGAWVALAEMARRGDALEQRLAARQELLATRPLPAVIQEGCDGIRQSISCGETVTTTIRNTDCSTDSGVLFDEIFFAGQVGQTVTITMTSNDFDPYLVLFDPDVEDVAEDEDSGPGNGAQITFRLNRSSNDWSVTPTPLEPDVTGTYTLSLACSGTGNDGFVSHPNVPGFQFKVTIRGATSIAGRLEPTCLPETVCVSGAIPGRPEVLLRVVGPRPNGLLWPTIVKFTTAEVEVVVRQVRTGQTKTYLLAGAAPGFDELTGLFDRNGFVP
jgi:hypothetical protein